MGTKYIEPRQTQIDSVKELIEEGNLPLVLRDIEMKDRVRLSIVSVLFDYADTSTFAEKVLENEYTENELIDYIKDETDITILDLIKAYKLDKNEKREIICDFLGVNNLATNEELSELIKGL